jgi:Rrf2 family protein
MLTKTSEYALRSVVYVAMQAAENKKVGVKEIAKELELPLHFTGKILQDLVRKGIIASVKGPNGGFYLSRPASDISIMDIVRVIDGLEVFKRCGLGLKNCSDTHPCPLHNDFKKYRDGLAALFTTKTIRDLVQDIENGQAYIRNSDKR